MSDQDKITTIEEILSNASIMDRIINSSDREEFKQIFADNGLELSSKDIDDIIAAIKEISESDAELDSNALDNVAGGVALAEGAVWVFKAAATIVSKGFSGAVKLGAWLAKHV